MDINKIPVGKNSPEEVNVIIEVPLGGDPIKYEIDKDSGAIFVDRFLHTPMFYPCNYGFIPHTLSDDGDPADVLVIGRHQLLPGSVITSRPVGVLIMEDESGIDEKILAVPISKLDPFYDNIKDIKDVPAILIEQISHFFEHYKDLEKSKWVKIKGWEGKEKAIQIIEESIKAA